MQPTTKTIFLLSFLPVCLAGCLESKYPASAPDKDEIDQSLIGTWVESTTTVPLTGGSPTKRETFYNISRPAKGEDIPKGVLKVERERDGKKEPSFLIPTNIDDVGYFSVPVFDEKWRPGIGWKTNSSRVISFSNTK